MTTWRWVIALVLGALIAAPLAQPLAGLLAEPAAWQSWSDVERLLGLARNTLFLVAGTLTLALPPGIAGAVLLYRTDMPWRLGLRFLIILALFVPLPLFTSGWQAVLGSGGWLPLPLWNIDRPDQPSLSPGGPTWTPWGQGIGSAIWIHAVAGLPWVVLLVGQGLCWVERALEEDALTAAGSWRVLACVTLPRARAALGAATLWVGLQAATEITVTDVMQVRTFAEEVYTQFVAPEAGGRVDAVSRALAVTFPGVLLVALLLVSMARRWERTLPSSSGGGADLLASTREGRGIARLTPPLFFHLGPFRWPSTFLVLTLSGLLLGLPLGSLLWRAGLHGGPPSWSLDVTVRHLRLVARSENTILADSLLLAVLAGTLCAALGLFTCWAALGARWFRMAVLTLMALAWAMPGPVVGLGLKGTIDRLLDLTHSRFLAHLLWYGPSLAPLLWVDLIRYFPCAVAVLWPVLRLLPADLRDAARVDGARPLQELRHVVWPLAASAWRRAALVVGILSLGELSAGKLVSTPTKPSYAEWVFTQMHYGVTNDLAARCLLLLAAVATGGILLAGLEGWTPRSLSRGGNPFSRPAQGG